MDMLGTDISKYECQQFFGKKKLGGQILLSSPERKQKNRQKTDSNSAPWRYWLSRRA